MWFDGQRQPNTLYVASVSRGKDSTAMLRAIQLMGWPLDMICSVDIWFDEDTPAEFPPMVAFKDEWDKKCLDLFGLPVTRLCAHKREREREREPRDAECHSRITYTSIFYAENTTKRYGKHINGFPAQRHSWCKTLKETQGRYDFDLLRHILPQDNAAERERERERESCGAASAGTAIPEFTAFPKSKGIGVCPTSNNRQHGLSKSTMPLVYRRTQAGSIYGFPWKKGSWCQDRLKQGILNNPL